MRIAIFLLGYACGLATILVAAFVLDPTTLQQATLERPVDRKSVPPSTASKEPVATDRAPLEVLPQLPAQAALANGWLVSDDRDPIDDGQRITAILRDETGKARIELGCKRSKDGKSFLIAVVVLPGFYMSGPGANVVYRINSNPPIEGERWGKFPESANTLWILEPFPFLRRLKDNDSLFIRASDLTSEMRVQEARFNVVNYTAILTTLTNACPEPLTAAPAVATKAQGKR